MSIQSQSSSGDVALCVDLDFSLLATDVTYESIIACLKAKPWTLLAMPFWIARGKVAFKQELCARAPLYLDSLPVHDEVLSFVQREYESGRRCVLATASMRTIAEPLAKRFGCFTDVIATDSADNLGGLNKVKAIRSLLNGDDYDYIGDRSADFPVWQDARKAIVVNPNSSLQRQFQSRFQRPFDLVFRTKDAGLSDKLKMIRVHQWLKNLLLFVPLLLAHEVFHAEKLVSTVLAFVSFSLCASAVYIVNDLLDLESDRHHPVKKHRALASGLIAVHKAALLVPLLFAVAFGCAALLHDRFVLALIFYVLLTSVYSLRLKRIVLVDVFVLGGLYAYRVLCGSIAASVDISAWMLGFSMFMFLSLAFVKRYSELRLLRDEQQNSTKGRGYHTEDLDLVRSLGTASGYAAIVVLALYINSADVLRLYPHYGRLWLVVPLFLYWISRVWLISHRGEMRDDPVVFALEDKTSYLVAVVCALIIVLASLNLEIPL